MRISAISTGVGNLQSVLRALDRAVPSPKEIAVTSDPAAVRQADVLVVPGQGSFGAFAERMGQGLREAILEHVKAGKPYLGICLGLQILFDESDEAPETRGLGVLAGRVRLLRPGVEPDSGDGSGPRRRPLPHIGWNVAAPTSDDPLVAREHYYFAHSYAAVPSDATVTVATTEYGETFTSAVRKDNVLGVQFHPEKSQRAGLALLARFFEAARGGG